MVASCSVLLCRWRRQPTAVAVCYCMSHLCWKIDFPTFPQFSILHVLPCTEPTLVRNSLLLLYWMVGGSPCHPCIVNASGTMSLDKLGVREFQLLGWVVSFRVPPRTLPVETPGI